MNSTDPRTVLITGSTGLVGSALAEFLAANGHEVRTLVRREPASASEFRWDPTVGFFDSRAMEGASAIVHLAGEGIASGRWTRARKEEILRSRVEGTRLVAEAIRNAKAKPRVLVTASAIGFYGDRGEEPLDESSAKGTGFLAEVCEAWETAAGDLPDVRCVQLRTGVILSSAGGALKTMLLPFKLGLGGRLGHGRQWTSWITMTDEIRAIDHVLATEGLRGPVNLVAPNAARNADYTRVLAKVLRRPAIFPAPAFALRLALGEMADELLLASQHVMPRALEESGFEFAHPKLEAAMRHEMSIGRDDHQSRRPVREVG